MTKFLSLILILTLTLCGCSKKVQDNGELIVENEKPPLFVQQPDTTQKEEQAKPQVQQSEQKTEPEQNETIAAFDYKKLDCRKISGITWKQVRFTNDGGVTLHFEIPYDWELLQSEGGYLIKRDGKQIGTLLTQKPQEPESYYEYSSEYVKEQLVLKAYQVNVYTDTATHVFEFCTDSGTPAIQVFLCVDYTELDDSASEKLLKSAFTIKKVTNVNFPDLSQTNGSKKILLLGNSFFNSSRINVILNDMLSDTGYTVTAIARGGASVLTYTSDPAICSQVESGEYAYLFLCGFYNDENVQTTKIMLDCCNASNTRLIMFPAHNESQSVIDKTYNTYDGITLLDWRGELNSLISNGVDRWDLCVNDGNQHSTPIAGYVGAHMIYRNMFDTVPPPLTSAPISQAQVDAVLHGYAQSMHEAEAPVYDEFNGIEYRI